MDGCLDVWVVVIVTIEDKGRFCHGVVDSFVIQGNKFIPFRHDCHKKKEKSEDDEEMD